MPGAFTQQTYICLQGIAFAVPSVCMVGCAIMTPNGPTDSVTTGILVALMSVAFAASSWARAGLYCLPQDMSPKFAGALLGLTSTFGAVPGAIGTTSVGFLLDYFGDWGRALFYPTAAFQLIGLTVFLLLADSTQQDW